MFAKDTTLRYFIWMIRWTYLFINQMHEFYFIFFNAPTQLRILIKHFHPNSVSYSFFCLRVLWHLLKKNATLIYQLSVFISQKSQIQFFHFHPNFIIIFFILVQHFSKISYKNKLIPSINLNFIKNIQNIHPHKSGVITTGQERCLGL
jgi:hypothetical protein